MFQLKGKCALTRTSKQWTYVYNKSLLQPIFLQSQTLPEGVADILHI
jgi:hypothetical protein